MKARPSRVCWTLLAALAGLPGCPGPRPGGPGAGRSFETPAALLEAVRADVERLRGLRAAGTVDMRRAGERVKAHVLYLAERPGRLRFETESFFDSPLSILVSDGQRLDLWDQREGRFFTGRATAENLGRLLPAPLPPGDLVGVLLGQPPWIAHTRAELEVRRGAGPYVLVLANEREEQRVVLDAELLRPLGVELRAGGAAVYQLTYEDWVVRDGLAVAPEKILLELPGAEMHLRIKLKEHEVNPTLDPALFRLEPPEGLRPESLDPLPAPEPRPPQADPPSP